MRKIDKRDGHEDLATWIASAATQPTYDDLQNPLKDAVRGALIDEQFGLCAYCAQRVPNDSRIVHIEHLRPRHLDEGNAAGTHLDYANIVASCPGDRVVGQNTRRLPRPAAQLHCGHAKGKWWDENRFVNPTTELANRAFQYGLDGVAAPADGLDEGEVEAAGTTIAVLNLNSSLLLVARQAAVGTILKFALRMSGGNAKAYGASLKAALSRLKSVDSTGRLPSLQPVLVQALSEKLASVGVA